MTRRTRRARAGSTPAPAPAGPERIRPPIRLLLGGLALLAAIAVIHAGSLRASFYGDDLTFLDQVRTRSLWAALATPDPLGNYFRPLSRQVAFWLLGRAGGESPLLFHLASWTLWLLVLVLLFGLVRRLAGVRAAAVAVAFLALHYAADVALLWASDLQDLLATACALAALLLHLRGRRGWAAAAFALALLSKESAVVTPALAVLLDRRPGERWRATVRRAWPLWLCGAVWLALWLAMAARRAPGAVPLQPGPLAPVAALLHLVQVTTGLEWGPGGPGRPWQPARFALALALALGAVLWIWAGRWRGVGAPAAGRGASTPGPGAPASHTVAPPGRGPEAAIRAGLLWAILCALPVSAAVRFWSAYAYLFALCGLALALGAWLSRLPRAAAVAALALLALGSDAARGIGVLAIDYTPWTGVSHINRYALERGMSFNDRCLAMLRARRPTFPPRSTLFFAGMPKGTAFQTGNGELLRWAYRDSTLRSYFRSSFSLEKARRGPLFFYALDHDTLGEAPQTQDFYRKLALGMMLGDAFDSARDALVYDREQRGDDQTVRYWLGLLEWQIGRRDTAAALMRGAGVTPAPGPTPEIEQARARLAARDTAAAFDLLVKGTGAHGLDPEAHGALSDLALGRPETSTMGTVEALAARIVGPEDALAWRRWGLVQLANKRFDQAG
ncbi:MAG TPA: hypothetical protein VI792_04775, partial [Candidatus Eisenbacteria bacterium]